MDFDDKFLSQEAALRQLVNIQRMIDIWAVKLNEFRNLGLNEFTLQEIQRLEGKLIKHFCQQLDTKQKVVHSEKCEPLLSYPSLVKWLAVVGVGSLLSESLKKQDRSVEDLLRMTKQELYDVIIEMGGNKEDHEKLSSALTQLKQFQNLQKLSNGDTSDVFWTKINLDEETYIENDVNENHTKYFQNGSLEEECLDGRTRSNTDPSEYSRTAQLSPGSSLGSESDSQESSQSSKTFFAAPESKPISVTPATPARSCAVNRDSCAVNRDRMASTGTGSSLGRQHKFSASSSSNLLPPFNNLQPSKSQEWHIGNRVSENISVSNHSLTATLPPKSNSRGRRKKAKPQNLVFRENEIPNFTNISRSASRRSSTTISPEGLVGVSPLSPRTPMTPATPWHPEMWENDREIAPHTPKTPKLKGLKNFLNKFGIKKKSDSKKKLERGKSYENVAEDSHSNPRTPKLQTRSETVPTIHCTKPVNHEQFNFQGSSDESTSERLVDTDKTLQLVDTDKTVPYSDKTVPYSDTSDTELDATEATRSRFQRQGSVLQSEEWDIPYCELELNEVIGRGRVGCVYAGRWHGEVAIRVIDVNYDDEDKLRAFRQEVDIYKKTRHENLELFMGSCVQAPHLAIVTGFCGGLSLHCYIQKNRNIGADKAKIIAQHVAQGMGYLHSKEIIHKDLKSKNIFVDGRKVVITDFGLVGLHAISRYQQHTDRSGTLCIPDGWLCYLAPEVIRSLRFPTDSGDDIVSTLPYTYYSDVYAFGTVWYELLSGKWPFQNVTAESIIWQVGSGKRQNSSQVIHGGREFRDILMQAWSPDWKKRPPFVGGITTQLNNLPTTQILRSLSSHPARLKKGGPV